MRALRFPHGLDRRPSLLAVVVVLLALLVPGPRRWRVRGVGAEGPKALADQARTALRKELFWKRDSLRLDAIEANTTLAPFLGYEFSLPMPQLKASAALPEDSREGSRARGRAGLAYAGPRTRLRRFVRELLLGRKPVKIGVVGGSITYGHGTSKPKYGWFSVFSRWLITSFPNANITARNGAIPATRSNLMVVCLEQSVDADVDLVFVEYIVNNGYEDKVEENFVVKDVERLVRRLLALPGRPAVVLMQARGGGGVGPGVERVAPEGMAHLDPPTPFYRAMEDLEGAVAQYYDVQYLSLRTALYRLAAVERKEGFLWNQTFVDVHPGNSGNRMMADLAAYLVQDTARDLVFDPPGRHDTELLDRPLPPPMYEGNLAPERAQCRTGPALQSLVVSTTGWDWLDESRGNASEVPVADVYKRKWGYVSTVPGSELVLQLDSRPQLRIGGAGTGPEGGSVSLFVHHLKSYEHMGRAEIRCVWGCTCTPVEVDAHIQKRWSQTYLQRLDVSQSAECLLAITVLPGTSSGEHKFKVSGLVVADDARSLEAVQSTLEVDGRARLTTNGMVLGGGGRKAGEVAGVAVLLVVQGLGGPTAFAQNDESATRTQVRPELQWSRTVHHVTMTEVNSALAPFLGYRFSLPMPQLKAGLAYAGPRTRLRRFVRELLLGRKPVKIGVVGGSITHGHGTTDRAVFSWFSIFSNWLVVCLDQSVDADVDLVFVEYAVNNGFANDVVHNIVVKDVERLVRRLLALPGRPAVAPEGMAHLDPPTPFYRAMEDLEGAVAQYYDVQYLSLRTALYRLATVEQKEGFLWNQTFVDTHPGNSGNRMMADLAAYLVQDTALDLVFDPPGQHDTELLDRPLPPPMYEGNLAPDKTTCVTGAALKDLVASASGFEFVVEAIDPSVPLIELFKLKPGYVATTPGVWGCTCTPVEVDGHIAEHWSLTYLQPVMVSQSAECLLAIRVLPGTSSGEHKFKVSGVVVADNYRTIDAMRINTDGQGMLKNGPNGLVISGAGRHR
ncbi:hypothetical protein HYH03_006582 [Edaphochlamys debaryana]|uniref:SGNH hydrolase-type esterase domain-containing protein n=1 Tax=Edaphochlamys debaryana TaxID=47281 RepID=A0A836C039_9CHLO|nr:hypothetical protein HYH03_006582 [Edaphochlamys debaryana]|eukprot:KAG2495310.1 hypothetical protein HYH03_006582 [Edaphochlamys debaryana]